MLHKELGIKSLDMLRAACEADQVSELKGFGAKTQEKILAGIDFAAHADERMYWAEADEIVQELLAHMRTVQRRSGRWKSPAATAAAGRRSATSTCWSTRRTPTP